jgi:hypothetical protein
MANAKMMTSEFTFSTKERKFQFVGDVGAK